MNVFSGGHEDFFGLDIGTTALRVVQLKTTKDKKELVHYGQLPLPSGGAGQKAADNQAALTQAIAKLVKEAGVSTRRVAANLPSEKVFTTVIDMDRLSQEELAKTIGYQAGSFIPTPLAKSKIDWAVIGDSPADAKKVEILLSSVENSFAEERLGAIEAAGLELVAFEPDSLALCRSLLAADITTPQMVLDIGYSSTDLIISMNGAPRLVRAITMGSESIIRAAAQNMGLEVAQAQEYVYKYGLNKDNMEGKLYNAIIGTVDALISEIDKSIKFFSSRYADTKLDRIILTSGASSLPLFPIYVANKFGLNVEIGNSWRNVSYPPAKQNELLSVSNHFAVAAGLAERS
ncbi:MAG TPA: type IV pilus assembly protein PilM [Candidatus Saccharimonadales bacterium]|nr:type IV pilus assembly protein PilM [Candidatus Saccharimonadales bacterium]